MIVLWWSVNTAYIYETLYLIKQTKMHFVASLSEDKSSKFTFENLFEMKIETPPPRAPSGLEKWKPMYEGKKIINERRNIVPSFR